MESVLVHKDIKTGRGELKHLLAKLHRNTAQSYGRRRFTVVYNFMPVLDWVRTETRSILSDGSECLHCDPVRFAAFEIHALQRTAAGQITVPTGSLPCVPTVATP